MHKIDMINTANLEFIGMGLKPMKNTPSLFKEKILEDITAKLTMSQNIM